MSIISKEAEERFATAFGTHPSVTFNRPWYTAGAAWGYARAGAGWLPMLSLMLGMLVAFIIMQIGRAEWLYNSEFVAMLLFWIVSFSASHITEGLRKGTLWLSSILP